MNYSVQNKMCLLLSLTLPVNQQLSFPILLVVLFLMIIDISNLVLQYFFVVLLLMIIDCIFSIKNTNVRFFSSDRGDGGNFAKLFIGSVPRTATEEDVSFTTY